MDKNKKLTHLEEKYFKEITQLIAPSGFENQVANYLKNIFDEYHLETVNDNLGSMFCLKKSKNPNAKKVMIVAHMDEVGFYVGNVLSNGMIVPIPVGGFNFNSLQAQRVLLVNKNGDILKGAIDTTPPHLLSNKEGKITEKDILMDFGFLSKEDAFNNGVEIGSPMVCEGLFNYSFNKENIISKAIDDRYGIILGLSILNRIKDIELDYDLYIGGSVQEEVGCRGASTSVNLIKPDLAIILDCSPARDSLGDPNAIGKLGEGVLIRHFDRSMIANHKLLDLQINSCKNVGAKYQYFDSPGGTDAGVIHKSLNGVLTLTHCICARSIHTSSTIMRISDYIDARNSLMDLLLNLKSVHIDELRK